MKAPFIDHKHGQKYVRSTLCVWHRAHLVRLILTPSDSSCSLDWFADVQYIHRLAYIQCMQWFWYYIQTVRFILTSKNKKVIQFSAHQLYHAIYCEVSTLCYCYRELCYNLGIYGLNNNGIVEIDESLIWHNGKP